MLARYLSVWIFICGPLFGLTQSITSTESDFIIEEFTLPGGRLGNNVNAITEGPFGFLWLGSHGGLHRYDGYEVLSYTANEGDSTGLTFGYIENLYWDRFDQLWVCTYGGGLYRFDYVSESFTHFAHDPDDSSSISHERVMCAGEDAEGNLWFGTEHGLNRYDRQTESFQRFYADSTRKGSLSFDQVRSLYLDRQGTFWVGTGVAYWSPNLGGLNRYVPEKDAFVSYKHIPGDESSLTSSAVRALYEDSKGNFWVGTTEGLQKMDREKGTFQYMSYDPTQPYAPGARDRDDPAVYSVLEDRNGGLWVGTIGSYNFPTHLLRYDPARQITETFPVTYAGWQIYESRDGTIWVACAGESGKVLKITSRAKTYDLQANNPFYAEFEKKYPSSSGTLKGPIYLHYDSLRQTHWGAFVMRKGINDAYLLSQDVSSHEIQIYPLPGLDVNRRDGDDKANASSEYGKGIAVDPDGRIWGTMSTENTGLYVFDPQNGEIQQYLHDPQNPEGLPSNYILSVLADSRGDIWIATYDKGLCRLNPPTGTFSFYGPDREPSHQIDLQFAYDVVEDDKGLIWVGGANKDPSFPIGRGGLPVLYAIDPVNETVQNYPFPRDLFNTRVEQLSVGARGGIYFSLFENGIGGLEPADGDQIWLHNTMVGNFPFDNVGGIVADKKGYLWISSLDDNRFVRMQILPNIKLLFQSSSGWPSNPREGILGPDEHILFPNSKGWSEINPDEISSQDFGDSLNIRLVELYLNGQKQTPRENSLLARPIWLMDQLDLSHREQSFGFRFSDFSFRNNKVGFRFRLYPYEESWRNTDENPYANYYKIPPASYQFQVVPMQESGFYRDQGLDFKVVVHPPWWKSWWAYTLYGLAILAGILAFLQWRTRSLRLQRELLQTRVAEQTLELRHRNEELALAKQAAEAANEAKSTFLSTVSHELRTPLTSIIGFTKLNQKNLTDKVLPVIPGDAPKAQKAAQRISKNLEVVSSEGERLTSLINELLDLAKIESGKMEWKREAFRAAALIERAQNATAALFVQKPSLKLITAVPNDLPEITGDPDRLLQVLINLISNAVKFTDAGEVKLAVDIPPSPDPDNRDRERAPFKEGYTRTPVIAGAPLKRRGSEAGDVSEIIFSVSDTGSGIPADQLDKVFERFQQVEDNQAGKPKGTGLGLPICKQIVEHHGGRIWVESDPDPENRDREGKGSTFSFTLPLKPGGSG